MARLSKKKGTASSGMATEGGGLAEDESAPASGKVVCVDQKSRSNQPNGYTANDLREVYADAAEGSGLAAGVAVMPVVRGGPGGANPYTKLVTISQASLMEYKDTPWKNKRFGQIVATDRAKVLTEVLLKPKKTLQQARLVEYISRYCGLLLSSFHRGHYDLEIKEYIDGRIEKSKKSKKKKKTTVDSFFLTAEMRLRLYPPRANDEEADEEDEENDADAPSHDPEDLPCGTAGTSEVTVEEGTKTTRDPRNSGQPFTAPGFDHSPAALIAIIQNSAGVTGPSEEMAVVTPSRTNGENKPSVTDPVDTVTPERHPPTALRGKRKETSSGANEAAPEKRQSGTSGLNYKIRVDDGGASPTVEGKASVSTQADPAVVGLADPTVKAFDNSPSLYSDSDPDDEANLDDFYSQVENDGGDPGMDYFGTGRTGGVFTENPTNPTSYEEVGKTTPVKAGVVCLPAVEDVKLQHQEVKKRHVLSTVEEPRKKRFLSDVSRKEQLKLVSDFERKNLRAVAAKNAVVLDGESEDDDDCIMFLANRNVPSAEDAFETGVQALTNTKLRQSVLNSPNPRLELAKLGLYDYHVVASKDEMKKTELHNLLQKGTNKFVKFVEDLAVASSSDSVCLATAAASLPPQDETESLEFEKNGKTYSKNVVHPNKMERAFIGVMEVARRDQKLFAAIHKVHNELRTNNFLSPEGLIPPMLQLKDLLPPLLQLKEAARFNGRFEVEGGVHSTGLVRDLWHELLVTYQKNDHQKFANLLREMLYFGYDAATQSALEDSKKAATK